MTDAEKAKKYEEVLLKILTCYNYETPEKNAYLQWFKIKKERNESKNAFPDFIYELVDTTLGPRPR